MSKNGLGVAKGGEEGEEAGGVPRLSSDLHGLGGVVDLGGRREGGRERGTV